MGAPGLFAGGMQMHVIHKPESIWTRQRSEPGGLRGLAFALVLAASAAASQTAAAAVDLSGPWRVGVFVTQFSVTFTDVCALAVVQNQTTISMRGPCEGMANPVSVTGTIDPTTGRFTGSGSAGICPAITIDATGVGDSKTFAGRFSCPQLQASGGVNGSRCGNGQLDPGETCDDANLVNDDCCSARCQLTAAGASCTDDGNPCTRDRCTAAGQCEHVDLSGPCNDGNSCTAGDTCVAGQCIGATQPDTTPCDDGNACTTGDTCVDGICTAEPVVCPACLSCDATRGCAPTIDNGCKQSAVTSIVLKSSGTPAVIWKWQNGDATALRELGDPITTTDYDFCIYDGTVDQSGSPGLALSAQAPAGRNWYRKAAGFGYQSRDLAPDGVKRIRLRVGGAGAARAVVVGQGANLALQPLRSIVMPMTVQLKARSRATEQCWSSVYTRPAFASPTLFAAGIAIPSPDTRPNILLINLDDTRAGGIDRMPTVLSRLVAHGVSFTNSFVVDPLCAPSRASLLTGLSARHHGVQLLDGVIGGAHRFQERGADQQTIAVWLQAAGYATGLFGKYINGYEYRPTEQPHGPGETLYVPPGWTRWRGMTSEEHYGGLYGGTYTLVDEHGTPTVYGDHTTDRQYSTDVLAGELRTFIADTVRMRRPFFAVWTPYASHDDLASFAPKPAARHFQFFRGLPPWRPASWGEADVTDKPRWVQSLMPATFAARILDGLVRQGAYETLLAVDENLSVILDDLVQLGIDRNTVILLTSDNGVEWGEHRGYGQAKMCPYEECLRVPMIVRDPRFVSTAVARDATVLNIDVAPTVAALAGVLPPVTTDGVSFAPWVIGSPPAQWRHDVLLEFWRTNRGDDLFYSGQVTDGDRLLLLYGDSRARPRPSVLFEFNNSGGVTGGAVAVPIGVDADATFANLGTAVVAAVPFTARQHAPEINRLAILDKSPDHDGVYWLVERDQGAVITHWYPIPDYFGVRDVTNGFTYVEYESGETELYDLSADPAELENKAPDPSYASTRQRLSERLDALLK